MRVTSLQCAQHDPIGQVPASDNSRIKGTAKLIGHLPEMVSQGSCRKFCFAAKDKLLLISDLQR